MNPMDGKLCYRVTGCFEENDLLSDDLLRRLTYTGFNMFDKFVPGVFAIVYGNQTPAAAYESIRAAGRAARQE